MLIAQEPQPPNPSGDPLFGLTGIAEAVAQVIEGFGIVTIVLGVLLSTLTFLYALYQNRRLERVYRRYRSQLGRSILLGIEFLVAADIIGTVAVEPTVERLIVLGLIVLIRTFLSFSLEVEINGRWPWQANQDSES